MKLSAELFREITTKVRTSSDDTVRHGPRVGFSAEAMIILGSRSPEPRKVRVRDLSPTGIGFAFNAPLAIGTWFVLQLPRHEGAPLTLACQVAYCRAVSRDLYTIGAHFADAQPAAKPA